MSVIGTKIGFSIFNLQRDPADRANLEEIANDPWLQEGASAAMVQPATYLPLVSREHLSEEDHALILQKMVNGGIAAKEEILDALDKDEYNNITATYFLLAERKLRAQRQEQAMMVNRGQTGVPSLTSTPKELEVLFFLMRLTFINIFYEWFF